MKQVEKDFKKVEKERNKVIDELLLLEENEYVKRYIKLKEKSEKLYEKYHELNLKMIEENMKSCNHIIITDSVFYDEYDGHKYVRCGCIKCGLDERILDSYEIMGDYSKIIYNILSKKDLSKRKGIRTGVMCDLSLGRAIYKKIKDNYPKIDDETAKKYFEIALDDIRNKKVNEERKVSRAKRLDLAPYFSRWGEKSILGTGFHE